MKRIQALILNKPFKPEELSWRISHTTEKEEGKPQSLYLAYVEARDVQDRLDEAFGKHNWKAEYSFVGIRIMCKIGARVDGEWIFKEDGAGETAIEGEKGGLSDAFKRAGVVWGINRAAYSLENCWAKSTKYKTKSGKITYYPADNIKSIMAAVLNEKNKHYLEEIERHEEQIKAIKQKQRKKREIDLVKTLYMQYLTKNFEETLPLEYDKAKEMTVEEMIEVLTNKKFETE